MTVISEKIITPAEYLRLEKAKHPDQERSELVNGKIIDMPGGTPEHNFITGMIYYLLMSQLMDLDYHIGINDLKVNNPLKNYHYPDVFVVKGDLEFDGDHTDVITNPLVLIEVLSKSTADYDRSDKFISYRQIESLQEYILVSQEKYLIESFYKDKDGRWIVGEVAEGKDSTFEFVSMEASLKLEDVYKKVDFKQNQATTEEEA